MRRALTAAVLSALATGAVLATVGFGAANKSSSAKSSTGSSKSSTTKTTPPPTMKEALADREKEKATRQAALAKSLGVSTDKLNSAMDAVKKKNLDQAVKDNKLTAAQRDAIEACEKAPLTCDRSNLPAYGFGRHGGMGRHHGPLGGKRGDFVKDLAAELGVSEDKVTEALKANRPKMGDRDGKFKGRGGRHGHGGRGPGFGPPPGMDGASGPAEEVDPAAAA